MTGEGAGPALPQVLTSSWLQVSGQPMTIFMGFGGNTGHRHQHDPWPKDHPLTALRWLQRPRASNMASDGYICHSHQDSPPVPQAAKPDQAVSETHARICPHGSQASSCLGQQHGLQTPTWPLVASKPMVVLREGGPIQKVNFSSSWAFRHWPELRGILWLRRSRS